MSVIAKLRYLRIAPRKTRLVAELIRGKTIEEAQNILNFTRKRGSLPILKLLKQAIFDAKNNFQLEEKNLYISKILVDEGQKYKRTFPRARGKADEIQKKTSHITVFLDEIVKKPKKRPSSAKATEGKGKKKPEVKEVKEEVKEKIKIEKPKFKPETKIQPQKREGVMKKIFRRQTF